MANYQEYATYGRNLSRTRTDKFGRGGRGKTERGMDWCNGGKGGKQFRTASLQEVIADFLSLSCKFYWEGGERRQSNSAVYFCNLVVKRFSQDTESAHVYPNRAQCLFDMHIRVCARPYSRTHVNACIAKCSHSFGQIYDDFCLQCDFLFFRELHNFCPSPFWKVKIYNKRTQKPIICFCAAK